MHVWSGIDRRRSGSAADSWPADGLLQQAIERQLRIGLERSVLVLHLSRLLAPAPRPHHRRVARLVLDDAAQLYGGQVFPRPNGDLALICATDAASGLIETLARLFRADASTPSTLLSQWTLPQDAESVLTYAGRESPAFDAVMDVPVEASVVDAIGALIATTRFSDLVRRQMAVHITGTGARPMFHEVAFSSQAVQARVAAMAPARADPFLFRHIAARLDVRMLEAMQGEMTRAGPLALCRTIHLKLTLQGARSAGFLRFAAAARRSGVAVGIEISLLEACADAAGFAEAKAVLRDNACAVVLDAISHPALLITTPEVLEPDLIKLDWTPRMASLPAREQRGLEAGLQRLGLDRVVLQGSETEYAVSWGLGIGIRRFQGSYVDAMMGAFRITACPHAPLCTFRQCTDRGTATGEAGRMGCRNTALLDGGSP